MRGGCCHARGVPLKPPLDYRWSFVINQYAESAHFVSLIVRVRFIAFPVPCQGSWVMAGEFDWRSASLGNQD
jgi:hypothetical protein